MIRKNLLISVLLVVLFFSKNSFCQKKYTQQELDTMTLKRPFKAAKFNHFEKALKSDTTLIGWTYFYTRKAYFYQINRRHDSTLYYANKAIMVYEKLKTPPKSEINYAIISYYIKSVMLNKKKEYSASTRNLINALKIVDVYNPAHNYKGYIAYLIASNQHLLGDAKLRYKYARIALEDTTFKKLSKDYGGGYQFLAFTKEDAKEYDSAVYYHRQALSFVKKINNTRSIIASHNNLGHLFLLKENKDSVRYHFNRANELLKQFGLDSLEEGTVYQDKFVKANMAYLDILEGNFVEAEMKLNEVLKSLESKKIDNYTKELKNTCYDYLIECYYKKKDFKSIIAVSDKKDELLKAYENEFVAGKLQELETIYDVEKKKKRIAVLSEKNKEQEIIVSQQKIIIGVIGGSFILLCLTGYLYIRERRLKTNYEKILLEHKLLRSQMNPHFLFNALSTLCNMIREQSKDSIPYINKLSQLLRMILKNSRQDFITLEEEKQLLQDYLDLESNFKNNFAFELKISEELDEEMTCIPPMLVQPFVENAIQHGISGLSKKGVIHVHIKKAEKEETLHCIIKDNGKGYYSSKKNSKETSFSEAIVKERLAVFKKEFNTNCRFEVLLGNETGTEIHLFMPFVMDE